MLLEEDRRRRLALIMSFFNPFRSAQKPSQQQASASQGQPLELVKYDTDTGKFSLGQKALGILREVQL